MRLDSWLWSIRLFKSRTAASECVRAGHVTLGGIAQKASHEVRPGDVFLVRRSGCIRTVKVLAAPKSRLPAKEVPLYMEDLTPPEERDRERMVCFLPPGFRPRGSGRPEKRERRELDAFLDPEESQDQP